MVGSGTIVVEVVVLLSTVIVEVVAVSGGGLGLVVVVEVVVLGYTGVALAVVVEVTETVSVVCVGPVNVTETVSVVRPLGLLLHGAKSVWIGVLTV